MTTRNLKLVLKRKWYDMIASGEKKEEYRELNVYWTNRLYEFSNCSHASWPKDYETVTFYLGYAKNRPSMTFKLELIRLGEGIPEWGAEPGKEYFIIKLGERIK